VTSEQYESRGGAGKALVVLFLLTLPLVNPWVRGDGVGYYAYVRSLLIDGDLQFENEWLAGNTTFVQPKLDSDGRIKAEVFTPTGRVDNHFTVGPAVLWAPFLIVVHIAVVALDQWGFHIPADGYSPPYVVTMACATALYGFLGLFFSYKLAREYFEERWAFLATVGIWFASSLPVYMYFNPSWSHAHSAFVVALFLWYWHRTRAGRSALQWIALGLLGGLMLDVYYPNGVLLLVPLLESLLGYWQRWKAAPNRWAAVRRLFVGNVLFSLALVAGFLPTLITRSVLYGSPFRSGYHPLSVWNWTSPELWRVLFSSNHGLFSWTPILLLAVLGIFLLRRLDKELSVLLLTGFLGFYYLIASYLTWHGIASFGNRFFVSLTAVFVLGLAATLKRLEGWLRGNWALRVAWTGVGLLILWNAGFIFQWGTFLIPPRGPISWKQMAYNQVAVVPQRVIGGVRNYFVDRRGMMQRIERRDENSVSSEPVEAK